jgi:hypothetical protein
VLVLGVFQGGDVRFDVNGRTGKARSEHTASRGSEAEVVVVPNEHGTLFIGHYERLPGSNSWAVVPAMQLPEGRYGFWGAVMMMM